MTKKIKLSPSMMCADIGALKETLALFEEKGVDYLHIDVMDGVFVPNIMLGTDYCRQLRRLTNIPLDIHLMIAEPETKIAWFDPQPGEIVAVHAESVQHLHRVIWSVAKTGATPFVALNPTTPLTVLDYILHDIAGVMLMLVNPGFAGQKLIPETLRKIKEMRAIADRAGRRDFIIEVDGNISFVNAQKAIEAGADMLVLGTSSIFSPDFSLAEGLEKLNSLIFA